MKNCCNLKLQKYKNIDPSVDILKAVAEPNRLRVLYILSQKEICVCELAKMLDLAFNLISFHLKTLKNVGILDKKRVGNQIFYFIKPEWEKRVDQFFSFIGIK